jgi:hypothetical protein
MIGPWVNQFLLTRTHTVLGNFCLLSTQPPDVAVWPGKLYLVIMECARTDWGKWRNLIPNHQCPVWDCSQLLPKCMARATCRFSCLRCHQPRQFCSIDVVELHVCACGVGSTVLYCIQQHLTVCKIRVSCSIVFEDSILLDYDSALLGNVLPTF